MMSWAGHARVRPAGAFDAPRDRVFAGPRVGGVVVYTVVGQPAARLHLLETRVLVAQVRVVQRVRSSRRDLSFLRLGCTLYRAVALVRQGSRILFIVFAAYFLERVHLGLFQEKSRLSRSQRFCSR